MYDAFNGYRTSSLTGADPARVIESWLVSACPLKRRMRPRPVHSVHRVGRCGAGDGAAHERAALRRRSGADPSENLQRLSHDPVFDER
eukprot:gene9555-biopygen8277